MFLKDFVDIHINNYPMHMPGHKKNYNFFTNDILNYDLTEFGELDNLQNPTGIIKNSLDRISQLFSTKQSFILVNGSTIGILASLLYVGKCDILVGRNAHKSFFSGVFLTEANVHYIYPKINVFGTATEISPEDIEMQLSNNPNISAVFLTSPTYEGYTLDISSISKICHNHDCILIVDEAHGAHFPFSSDFPKSAIECGCDISINSLHKTLPALTQCGLLHINNNIDSEKMSLLINTLQTTSPSYIFMYAIDKLMEDIQTNKINFNSFTKMLLSYRKKFSVFENIHLYEDSSLDISRFTFFSYNYSGKYMSDFLKENGIQVEMFGFNYIVCIITVCDTNEGLTLLYETLNKLNNKSVTESTGIELPIFPVLKSAFSYKEIFLHEKILVDYKKSLNKICGCFITPYPPGIPIVCPGEIINNKVIDIISMFLQNNIEVIGVNDNNILIRS